jgi:hypothetical protein
MQFEGKERFNRRESIASVDHWFPRDMSLAIGQGGSKDPVGGRLIVIKVSKMAESCTIREQAVRTDGRVAIESLQIYRLLSSNCETAKQDIIPILLSRISSS